MKPLVCGLIVVAVFTTPRAVAQAPLFRSRVDVVELDVSVMRGNVPVAGLTARDFSVTDNGDPQEVTSASLRLLPLRITMVFDVSGSVSGPRLTSLVSAGHALIETLRGDDQASLISFSHQVMMRVPMGPATPALHAALDALSASGSTALRDAVHLGLALQPQERVRTLILLFSDGLDTNSWLSGDDVMAIARRANTVVHVVRVGRDPFLDQIADITGGRVWSARSDKQLQELFTQALEEMRARYVLSYSPAQAKPGWHAIKVSVKNVRAEVTARAGYVVP